MDILKIIVERSFDYYDAYAENCEGVYGAGETPEEAKQNALNGLKLFIESRKKEDLPSILQGKYEIIFQFDVQSLLRYYDKIFNKSALEHITGVNQKLLHHYSSGLKMPRFKQRKRIEYALHNLGKELLSITL